MLRDFPAVQSVVIIKWNMFSQNPMIALWQQKFEHAVKHVNVFTDNYLLSVWLLQKIIDKIEDFLLRQDVPLITIQYKVGFIQKVLTNITLKPDPKITSYIQLELLFHLYSDSCVISPLFMRILASFH